MFPVLCGSATQLIGVDRLAKFLVEEAPAPSANDGQTAVQVFKTIVDPYVGSREPVQGAQGSVKHDEVLVNARTHADERLHQLFTMRGKEQDAVDGGRGRRHRRGRQAQRPRDRRRARDQGRGGRDRGVRAARTGARGGDPRQVQGRRGQARQRAAPVAGGRPGAPDRARPRDASDVAPRHGRDPPLDRARAPGAEVRRRSRERRGAGRVPRDDRRRSRSRRQGEEAERWSRAVRRRVAAGRADRARIRRRVRRQDRRRRHPPPVHPRRRKGCHRNRGVGRRARLPHRRRARHLLRRESTTRSTARRWRSRPRPRTG